VWSESKIDLNNYGDPGAYGGKEGNIFGQ